MSRSEREPGKGRWGSGRVPNLEPMRHSAAHVLAMAVLEMFPEAELGIGPVIENGFYYDFGLPRPLDPQDLPRLKERMRRIIKANHAFVREEIPKEEVLALFGKLKQPYKVELAKELQPPISLYRTGPFVDLCEGPHVARTGLINPKGFTLTRIAGAYWKGSEKNPMLQRIYGVAFWTPEELTAHLDREKELEKRDHRKLAHDLDLFSFSDAVGPGLVLWHPKGALVRSLIEDYWRAEHSRAGYQLVYTPHIGNLDLWKQSGHWSFYRDAMFSPMTVDTAKYLVKPMNCPLHVQVYRAYSWSYRDLPVKFCELGTVYRYEKPGVLHGLLRVRGFTQDDAHIFARADQLPLVLTEVLGFLFRVLRVFGFRKYAIELSVRDPKGAKQYLGSDELWKRSERALAEALEAKKLAFERREDEAVFYGPKIDVKLIDALGRFWQGPTVQVDFNLPEKFDLAFINRKGKKERLVMIHRAIFGSLERFLGLLIEHYGGAFPLWLAPIQVQIIPVGSRHGRPSEKLARELREAHLRVAVDDANETVGYKIRKAEKLKVPTMLVVGDKEVKSRYLHVRFRGKKEIEKISKKRFAARLLEDIAQKR